MDLKQKQDCSDERPNESLEEKLEEPLNGLIDVGLDIEKEAHMYQKSGNDELIIEEEGVVDEETQGIKRDDVADLRYVDLPLGVRILSILLILL